MILLFKESIQPQLTPQDSKILIMLYPPILNYIYILSFSSPNQGSTL